MIRFYLQITKPLSNSEKGVIDAGRQKETNTGQTLRNKTLSFSKSFYLYSTTAKESLSNHSFKWGIIAHICFVLGFIILVNGYRAIINSVIVAVEPWDIIFSVVGMILYGIIIIIYLGVEILLIVGTVRRWRSRSG